VARARSRATEAGSGPVVVPLKLQRFTFADWEDRLELVPADWGFSESLYRRVRAHARYAGRRRDWAKANGITLREMSIGFVP
jgi:hypothetical protein